jgi:hypothetical protein
MSTHPSCRVCGGPLTNVFVDLGMSPLANSYVKAGNLSRMEPFYPLRAYVCSQCLLVQLQEFETPADIFSNYAYFSSYSTSWLEHAERFARETVSRFGLGTHSQVIEIASNDGYLLQYFKALGVPVLGIEPAQNVARVAVENGIPTRCVFFDEPMAHKIAEEGLQADLLIGINVLAHVPNLHSFTAGLKTALKPDGVIALEFPHLLNLLQETQFDTIYHEHFSYFSLFVVEKLFERYGLSVFDVEELPTHGGSLRVCGKRSESTSHMVTDRVARVLGKEYAYGLDSLDTYRNFAEKVRNAKCDLLEFFVKATKEGATVAGYGAPAKGNTLLNYCGIGCELLPFTVDRSPYKQGAYLPGTHIPILAPEAIEKSKPNYVLILPWNLKEEIMQQMACVRAWGGRFVVAIPSLQVFG